MTQGMHTTVRRSAGAGFSRAVLLAVVALAAALLLLPATASAAGWAEAQAWGHYGQSTGQLSQPTATAVALDGSVYVTDAGNNCVYHFTSSGTLLAKWGSAGSAAGKFNAPYGIATDANGLVYVADTFNSRIQVFEADGTLVRIVGAAILLYPYGVAVDNATGDIYVPDGNHHRIVVFNAAGVYQRDWIGGGSGEGALGVVTGIALDGLGHAFVSDWGNRRIVEYSASSGAFILERDTDPAGIVGPTGMDPYGLAVDGDGNLYVADGINSRVLKYANDSGAFDYTGPITTPGPFECFGISFDADGDLWATAYDGMVLEYGYDTTPPVVSCDYDGEWHNQDLPVRFSAVDALAGTNRITYLTSPLAPVVGSGVSLSGEGSVAFVYAALADHSHDGISRTTYSATDFVNNQTAPYFINVKIDTRAPITTVLGLPQAYSKGAAVVWFEARDVGSGVRTISYDVDTVPPATTLLAHTIDADEPVTIAGNGAHHLYYRSTDNSIGSGWDTGSGNLETLRTATINVDDVRPATAAAANVAVLYRRTAKLTYKVTDAYSPKATTKIVIKKGAKIVKTLALGQPTTGANHVASFAATLAKGVYTWYVYATDLAGNAQVSIAHRTLTVK
jgi:sugar lactone lactonase YvrE